MFVFYLSLLKNDEERKSIATLYEKHRYLCLYTALKILKDKSQAEDAVQEAFVSVIKNKDKILKLSDRDFVREIIVIVKNKCFDIIRKNKNHSAVSFEEVDSDLPCDEDTLDIQVINRETLRNAKRLISQIDEISRAVLIMKYIKNFSYKEIGEVLNMVPKHIETRIARAKMKIRKLSEDGNNE